LENRRKGFDLLLDVLPVLRHTNVNICVIGNLELSIKYDQKITFLGKISDERLLALAYSAADIFLLPSREDNLPNVMIESVACGTPVIAFPVGGIPDVIKTGLNGILANNLSSESLVQALNDFIQGKYTFDSRVIRDNALQMFSSKLQVTRYFERYQDMLESETKTE
jgi:glycosyltransferase involved in cell wall biosynthesis